MFLNENDWEFEMCEETDRFSVDADHLHWSQCVYCSHSYKKGYCPAFPNGIPEDIRLNLHDHHAHSPGDGGILYEPKPGYENKKIVSMKVKERKKQGDI